MRSTRNYLHPIATHEEIFMMTTLRTRILTFTLCTTAAMLAAPLATFLYYREASLAAPSSLPLPSASAAHVESWKRSVPVSCTSQSAESDWLPWIVQAWFLGVIFFGLRSLGGFFLLERMRRRQSTPVVGRLRQLCLELQGNLGLKTAVRYCQCAWLEAPAVIGWFRPIVFLPLIAWAIWIGVYPKPYFDVLEKPVAQIVEHGSRAAEDQTKLSTQFGDITDLIIEAAGVVPPVALLATAS